MPYVAIGMLFLERRWMAIAVIVSRTLAGPAM